MIDVVAIEDYQAIRRASLRLGKFTVVTGPTGSGKSAVVRAMKLVAFNASGTSYVRHGAKTAKAALGLEATVVGITRGGRADKYTVASLESGGGVLTEDYPKLNKQVPPEVAALLKLGDINFAGQFDRPFLLAESGGAVARVLGELTNVTLVFDAAREANRRKLEISRELKMWQQSLVTLTAQARAFATLKARREMHVEAQDRYEDALYIEDNRSRLLKLAQDVVTAEKQLAYAEDYLEATAPPSAEKLDSLQARRLSLLTLYAQYREAERAEGQWGTAADAAVRDEEKAHRDLHEALVAAGTCPTCGQEVGE